MNNDMDRRVTPGLELNNNMCECNYPQKFMHAANPNKPGPSNNAAKNVNANDLAMRMFRGL